eukprot:tig00021234_g19401.t1
MAELIDQKFPSHALLPKHETGAISFLRKHPHSDGRGTVVAILDTGVDPGARGLQVTSDGKPKIIDIIDCCGSGDVEMTVVQASTDAEGKLSVKGPSGRTLLLNPSWANPTGVWRAGLKRSWELYSPNLVPVYAKQRKEAFEAQQSALVAGLARELAEWEQAHPSGPANDAETEAKAELAARLEAAKELMKGWEDPGLILDCLVWHDGSVWRAVVDSSETGDLRNLTPMTNYRLERQFSSFCGEKDYVNYSVNIYDEGRTLSIVTTVGSHGTHVAAIVGAHHPGNEELDGVAPGCQIVSLKIGDTRLKGEETGTGLTRAAAAIIEHGCDLANMSFGEAALAPNAGRWVELARDLLVRQRGLIFCSSAGNGGPALSTVGAPGGTTSGIISVGAYVSAAMQQAEYAMLERVPEQPYTWSSRGPTTDGDAGVTVLAPGGAITSVPQYTLQPSQLMNGTSMASPNACGNLALLVSGLKAAALPVTVPKIVRAIQNTAEPVEGTLGAGLLQVDRAWDYLQKYPDFPDYHCAFEATIPDLNNARGFYFREVHDTGRVTQAAIRVQPRFRDEETTRRLQYEGRVALTATAPWVRVPAFLLLNGGGRDFQVRVDPTALPEGLHYAEIQGHDAECPGRGPLFRVPVYVCKPLRVPAGNEAASARFEDVRMEKGRLERRYVENALVPEGAGWAEVTFRARSVQGSSLINLVLYQLSRHRRYSDHEFSSYYTLTVDKTWTERVRVIPGTAMELVLAQFWSSLGSSLVSVHIAFRGLQLCPAALPAPVAAGGGAGGDIVFLDATDVATRIDVRAAVRQEELAPTATLKFHRRHLRPAESVVRPLGARDLLPQGKQVYELLLTYKLKLAEAAAVTLRLPALQDWLYDAGVDSVLYMVFDGSKKLLGMGDVYVKTFQLGKGGSVVRVQLRHDEVPVLERLAHMVLVADTKLAKEASVPVYGTLPAAVAGKDAGAKRTLRVGERATLYLGRPEEGGFPKDAAAGDALVGELALEKKENGDPPAPATLVCSVPPAKVANKDKDKPPAAPEEPAPSAAAKLAEAVRDLKVSNLLKEPFKKDAEARGALAAELLAEHPNHVPLLLALLRVPLALESGTAKWGMGPAARAEVLAGAERVVAAVDPAALAAHFGTGLPAGDSKAKKAPPPPPRRGRPRPAPLTGRGACGQGREEAEKKKEALVEALAARCLALAAAALPGRPPRGGVARSDPFFEAFTEFTKWAPDSASDPRFLQVWIAKHRLAGHTGTALRAVTKAIGEGAGEPAEGDSPFARPSDRELHDWRAELLQELGWAHWTSTEASWALIRFPAAYPPF